MGNKKKYQIGDKFISL